MGVIKGDTRSLDYSSCVVGAIYGTRKAAQYLGPCSATVLLALIETTN